MKYMVKDVFVIDKIKVFPEPHRYAICTSEGISIKEFYKGFFEEVFVFYHPFIKPLTMEYDLFNPDTYPSRNELRNNCEKVSWKQFLMLSGIESYKQLDIGVCQRSDIQMRR